MVFHCPLFAAEIIVAPSGGDYTSIQEALDVAQAGDTVTVEAGTYHEAIDFPRSGSAAAGHIILRAASGENVVIDPNSTSSDVIYIENRSYLKIIGLKLTNSKSVSDKSGIRIEGWADHIEIRNNEIYDLLGSDAMGITVYGTSAAAVSDIVIDGNHIHDCEPAHSEALVLNGNITDFEVTNNTVHDVNNIGIDCIGGESWTGNHGVARNGTCSDNEVYRARSSYGGGYAAGIYIDGGKDIIIERNIVHECDLGIEIGAENAGYNVTGVIVRNNNVYNNDKVGIVFGGYESGAGRVTNCEFTNNTLYKNDTLQEGNGEFWISYAEGNLIRNNIVYAGTQNLLIYAETGSVNNTFDYNLYYSSDGAGSVQASWRGTLYTGFENYRSGTGQDPNSLFTDPLLVNPGADDHHIQGTSPAINAGDTSNPGNLGEFDIDGEIRIQDSIIDIGADESSNSLYETIRINFQRSSSDLPQGYLKDDGAAYGSHGAYSYGWQ